MSTRPVKVRLTVDVNRFTGRLRLITEAVTELDARLRWNALLDAERAAARAYLDRLADAAWSDLGLVRPKPLLWEGDQA